MAPTSPGKGWTINFADLIIGSCKSHTWKFVCERANYMQPENLNRRLCMPIQKLIHTYVSYKAVLWSFLAKVEARLETVFVAELEISQTFLRKTQRWLGHECRATSGVEYPFHRVLLHSFCVKRLNAND